MGDFQKAEFFLKKALEISRKVNGLDHKDTISTMQNLGSLFDDLGQYQRAKPLLEEALKLNEKIRISKKAWRMSSKGYSSMFIMPGDKVSVENLLKGIIIVSGNDACLALAQGIAGTEEEFVNMMNSMAEKIGLPNTKFSNSSGL